MPRHQTADGGAEDDGYLIGFAHDRGRGTSYLAILDAADVAAAPVGEVHLPLRVPAGFHGSWIPSGVAEATDQPR